MSTLYEPAAPEVKFDQSARETPTMSDAEMAIFEANCAASDVDTASFNAFVDLLEAADSDYIGATAYAPSQPEPAVEWEAISQALGESQAILIGMQKLLSATLAEMGVVDHEFIRVYSDTDGSLKLVSDHPRREEIEAVLNSPAHAQLRELYQAAISGMSLAGSLVGAVTAPQEILEKLKAESAEQQKRDQHAA